jgi:hypothetical protein
LSLKRFWIAAAASRVSTRCSKRSRS